MHVLKYIKSKSAILTFIDRMQAVNFSKSKLSSTSSAMKTLMVAQGATGHQSIVFQNMIRSKIVVVVRV